ncbi:hypothetical protein ACH5RR_013317 [Cinchona calisaya]|uniref:DUF4216 domain-containing protein n=1 Tax=Cinchona calisaya TaxID=153742 RepID=A0ABD2ZZN8_9GENT
MWRRSSKFNGKHVKRSKLKSYQVRPFARTNYVTLKEEEYNVMHCEHEKELMVQNPTLRPEYIGIMQKQAFPSWFGKQVEGLCKKGIVRDSDDIYSLALSADMRVGIYSGCTVNGIKFLNKKCDTRRVTQNSGVCVEGFHKEKHITFYGILGDVIELNYVNYNCKIVLFKCEWFDLHKSKPVAIDGHFTSINISRLWYDSDPYILSTQAIQVFYINDTKLGGNWQVVQKVHHRHLFDSSLFSSSEENLLEDNQTVCSDAYQEDESSSVQKIDEIVEPEPLVREDVDHEIVYVVDNDIQQRHENLISTNDQGEGEWEDYNSDDDDTLDDMMKIKMFCTKFQIVIWNKLLKVYVLFRFELSMEFISHIKLKMEFVLDQLRADNEVRQTPKLTRGARSDPKLTNFSSSFS